MSRRALAIREPTRRSERDLAFARWLAATPPVVLAVIVAVVDGEPVTHDEIRVALPYMRELEECLEL